MTEETTTEQVVCVYCNRPEWGGITDMNNNPTCRLHGLMYNDPWKTKVAAIIAAADSLGYTHKRETGRGVIVNLPNAVLNYPSHGIRYEYRDCWIRIRPAGDNHASFSIYVGRSMGGDWHPHSTAGGSMCQGSWRDLLSKKARHDKWLDFLSSATIMTCTYNARDAYRSIAEVRCTGCQGLADILRTATCKRCGAVLCRNCRGIYSSNGAPLVRIRSGEISHCYRCSWACGTCYKKQLIPKKSWGEDIRRRESVCVRCAIPLCENCRTECEVCKKTFCESCMQTCSGCGKRVCRTGCGKLLSASHVSTTMFCDDCYEKRHEIFRNRALATATPAFSPLEFRVFFESKPEPEPEPERVRPAPDSPTSTTFYGSSYTLDIGNTQPIRETRPAENRFREAIDNLAQSAARTAEVMSDALEAVDEPADEEDELTF